MASKQPFKLLDIKTKSKNLLNRLHKVVKHKILSKSRNALILRDFEAGNEAEQFVEKLKTNLKRTWEIHEINVKGVHQQQAEELEELQKKFGGKQYDAIIVPPLFNRKLKGFYSFDEEGLATDLASYHHQLFSNILAYRMGHKFLATGGVMIFSNSESDFATVQRKQGKPQVLQPALKNILDAQVSYLTVTIGDRDYTDLNSWSVMGLSEEFIASEHEDFIVKMYGEWADGRNLPMPGSFAIFKTEEQGKTRPFVQYL